MCNFLPAFVAGVLVAWLGTVSVPAALVGADAVVLVNSASAKYLDFRNNIQPYLDHFGVPYSVLDIKTNAVSANIGNFALIIVGHQQLDTNHVYLDAAEQGAISLAVSNGTGLVNFDSVLSGGGVITNYQYVQDLFNFTYTNSATGTTVTFPATEAGGQLHYVTACHATNETLSLRSSLAFAGLTPPANVTTLALSSGKPLLLTRKTGAGRAVQWAGYGWMTMAVKGPVAGLDDLVWRSLVWAARKPFAIRGMPNHAVMRVDDVGGPQSNTGIAPMSWLRIATETGFKPHVEMFFNCLDAGEISVIRNCVTNGQATASIHSQGCGGGTFFYFDHANKRGWPDDVMGQNYTNGTLWLQSNGIPHAKTMCPHYSEVGTNIFGGLKNWGVEFISIEIIPGQVEYATPGAPWLVAGPYRLYETPQEGQTAYPFFYADFLPIPNHPEFSNQFFACYTEIRDDAPCQEWCPDTDVTASVGRGVRQLKRAFDSQVMGTLFTHDHYFYKTVDNSSTVTTTMPTNTWKSILQGITNGLAAYQPQYVTIDYACQYARATRTAKIASAQYDTTSGAVNVTMSGKADLVLKLQIYLGADNAITNVGGDVPAFTNTVAVAFPLISPPLTITNQPQSQTAPVGTNVIFSVGATGSAPLNYQWRFNTTNLPAATNAAVLLAAIQTTNAGDYSVIVSDATGSATSSVATLTVLVSPGISSQPATQNVIAGSNATFTVSATGTGPLNYSWRFNGTNLAGATNSIYSFIVQATNEGGYSVLVSNLAGAILSSNALLTVLLPPAITSSPPSQTVVAGANAVFTVGATGSAPLTFQWQWNGTNISSATNSTYAVASAQATNAGLYAVVIGNPVATVTSSNVLLTVLVPPGINNQPQNQSVILGSNATFTVSATGTAPLNYSWRFNGTNLAGATNSIYSFIARATNEGGYSVTVSNLAGSIFSSNVLLTVLLPPAITNLLQNQSAVVGSNVTFVVGATGTAPLHYQWRFNGTNLAGATNSIYSFIAQATNAGGYAVTVSNLAGSILSSNVLLTVLQPPTITSAPQSQTVVTGSNVVFTVGAAGSAPLTFQWQWNGTNLSGATNSGYAVLGAQATNAGFYAVMISNPVAAVTSPAALLTVLVPPGINSQPQSRTVIVGSNAIFTVTATGTAPLSYQWQFSGTNITDATDAVYSIAEAQMTNAGVYAVAVSNLCGSVMSAEAVLTLLAPPAITNQPQGMTVTSGTNVAFTVGVMGSTPLGYQWQKDDTNIVGASASTYTLTQVQPEDTGKYAVLVSNAVGTVVSTAAILTVTPPAPPVLHGYVESNLFVISFTATPGNHYVVEYTDDLDLGSWSVLTNLTATETDVVCYDTLAPAQRYYRVRITMLMATTSALPGSDERVSEFILAFDPVTRRSYSFKIPGLKPQVPTKFQSSKPVARIVSAIRNF